MRKLKAGEVAEAREVTTALVELSRATKWDAFVLYSPVFALLAAAEGRYEAAARLLGFVEGHAGDVDVEVNEQKAYDLALAEIERHLDGATRERLMAAGRTLDEADACGLTLEPARPAIAARVFGPGSSQ